jgi:hypothetical protein
MTAAWEQRLRRTDAYLTEIARHRETAQHHRAMADTHDQLADEMALKLAAENVATVGPRMAGSPMLTGHSIVWEFSRDVVRPTVICEALEGSDCRLGPEDYRVCQCESWSILRGDDGRPYHLAEAWGDEARREAPARHYLTDSGECQVVLFLTESDCIEESCDDTSDNTFEVGRTQIEPIWRGDYYDWKRVTS